MPREFNGERIIIPTNDTNTTGLTHVWSWTSLHHESKLITSQNLSQNGP